MAMGLGVMHVFSFDNSLPADLVPVDFSVNIIITACWENATSRISDLPVYNFSTSPRNPYSWRNIEMIYRKYLNVHGFQQAIWYTSVIRPPRGFLEKLAIVFFHEIPGYAFDWVAVAVGKKPRLTKIYKRLSLLKQKLDYFVDGMWEIENDNTTQLMNKLCNADKELFPSDLSKMNIEEYFLVCRLGTKYFYLKENIDDTTAADRKTSWLKLAHYSFQLISGLAALKLMVGLANVLPI